MAQKPSFLLRAAHVLVWVLFVGISYVAGALLVNYLLSVFFIPERAADLGLGLEPELALDLSGLMAHMPGHYHLMMGLIVLATAAKALLFYFLIELPYGLSLERPFTAVGHYRLLKISYAALASGALLLAGQKLAEYLSRLGIVLNGTEAHTDGAGELLMMAGILFFVAQVFKRGVEIQTENQLTI